MVSPPWMRRIQSLPSHLFSPQPINHWKTWLIVSVLCHALYFHNGVFSCAFANISTSLHKLADAQSAGAWDMIPFCCPRSCEAAPCLQGGQVKAQMSLIRHELLEPCDKKSTCAKAPVLPAVICSTASVPYAGNGRLNRHLASCCVIFLTVCINYWICLHSTNAFAVIHMDLWKLALQNALSVVLIPKASGSKVNACRPVEVSVSKNCQKNISVDFCWDSKELI